MELRKLNKEASKLILSIISEKFGVSGYTRTVERYSNIVNYICLNIVYPRSIAYNTFMRMLMLISSYGNIVSIFPARKHLCFSVTFKHDANLLNDLIKYLRRDYNSLVMTI